MSGELSDAYVVARRALLNALEALGPQRDAVVLVGAQAIYVHTGDAGLAVAEYTTDADVALDPSKLFVNPELADTMRRAGFYRDITETDRAVGIWSSRCEIDGVPAIVKVDLLMPAALGGGGSRAARVHGHEKESVRVVSGLEGCLIDMSPHVIAPLESGDTRSFEIMVAGPASLLVSKVIKINERVAAVDHGGRDRRKNKDALDVLRILRAVAIDELAVGIGLLLQDELSRSVTETALEVLPGLFGTSDGPGSLMAAEAAFPLEPSEVTAASCAALVTELLGALDSTRPA